MGLFAEGVFVIPLPYTKGSLIDADGCSFHGNQYGRKKRIARRAYRTPKTKSKTKSRLIKGFGSSSALCTDWVEG